MSLPFKIQVSFIEIVILLSLTETCHKNMSQKPVTKHVTVKHVTIVDHLNKLNSVSEEMSQ